MISSNRSSRPNFRCSLQGRGDHYSYRCLSVHQNRHMEFHNLDHETERCCTYMTQYHRHRTSNKSSRSMNPRSLFDSTLCYSYRFFDIHGNGRTAFHNLGCDPEKCCRYITQYRRHRRPNKNSRSTNRHSLVGRSNPYCSFDTLLPMDMRCHRHLVAANSRWMICLIFITPPVKCSELVAHC